MGQEYRPSALLGGVERISNSISVGITGWKTKDPALLRLGKYSEKCVRKLGILEASLGPTETKWLFRLLGNSEGLSEIPLFPGRFRADITFPLFFFFSN